jgi:N-acyl-L-homoserine lactone synthetase
MSIGVVKDTEVIEMKSSAGETGNVKSVQHRESGDTMPGRNGHMNGVDAQMLAILFKVAHLMIDRAAPVRFALAVTDAERMAIYRQRYETVVERGWAKPEDFPDGAERDEYDGVAVHIAGWDGNTLAASARLVFPGPGQSLPTEQAFAVHIEPRGQVVDFSRQIVARGYSNSNWHAIFSGLLSYSWLQAQARGFYYVCGDFTPSMVRLYKKLGLHVHVVGESQLYWGEVRFPIMQDMLGAASRLAELYLEQ